VKFLTGSFAKRLQHINHAAVPHVFQCRQSFDECFVQFFTTSQFVSDRLSSGLGLLCRKGFRHLVEANYPQCLRDAVLTSA
jgi:hypothetical protein